MKSRKIYSHYKNIFLLHIFVRENTMKNKHIFVIGILIRGINLIV